MERTTKIFLLNDTSKALQNQDFSENWFRSGHSFSSQSRYDHFDTAPCKSMQFLCLKNMISSQPCYDHFDTAAYYISNALPTHKKRGHHIENRRSFKIPVFARLFTKPSPTASYGFKSALVQPLRCCYLHFSPLRNQSYYTTPFLFSQVDKRDFSSFYCLQIALGQFTRNYTQTMKRAADNKRRYAPGRGSIALVYCGGIQRGQRPIWHTTLLAKCSVLYALSALP